MNDYENGEAMGVIRSIGETDRTFVVVRDHGKPFAIGQVLRHTHYRHEIVELIPDEIVVDMLTRFLRRAVEAEATVDLLKEGMRRKRWHRRWRERDDV